MSENVSSEPQIEPTGEVIELAAEGDETKGVAETKLEQISSPQLSIEEQMKELEAKLDALDNLRMKSVVEELEFDAMKLALVSSDQAEVRYKRAWKEGQKLIKQCAWSGLRRVQLDSSVPSMNGSFVHDLLQAKFKAKIVTINGVEKIEVRW